MPYSPQSHDIKNGQQTRLKIWEINTGPVSRRYKHDPAAVRTMHDCVIFCVCGGGGVYLATLSVAKCQDRVTLGRFRIRTSKFAPDPSSTQNAYTHTHTHTHTHTYIYIYISPPPGATQPIVSVYFTALYRALASSRTRLLDHIQRRAKVGRTPLNE